MGEAELMGALLQMGPIGGLMAVLAWLVVRAIKQDNGAQQSRTMEKLEDLKKGQRAIEARMHTIEREVLKDLGERIVELEAWRRNLNTSPLPPTPRVGP